jgi:hypothetical protein
MANVKEKKIWYVDSYFISSETSSTSLKVNTLTRHRILSD